MELLGDVGHVESHFSPFGGSVTLDTRWVYNLHQKHHRLRNHFFYCCSEIILDAPDGTPR
jgi:hypothetical protein